MTTAAPSASRNAWDAFVRAFADVWEFSAWGVSFGDIALASVVMAAAFAFRRSVSQWVLRQLRSLAQTRNLDVIDQVLEAMGPPLTFVPSLMAAFFVVHQLGWSGDTLSEGAALPTVADNLLTTATAVLVFWALVRVVDPLMDAAAPLRRVMTVAMFDWIRRGMRFFLLFLGAAAILEDWGIPVGPILASLGIFGVAVALGAQDLFKNLIAGLLILTERRFEAGEWIKVDGVVEGTVERIGFRSTHVRRFDKGPVFVPNARLADSPLINFTRMSHRRIYWMIGVEYSATMEQLKTVRDGIADYLANSDEFVRPPETPQFVRIDKFNDSSIDLMLYCFTRTTNWGEWLEIKERLALAVKQIVEDAGTGFAFPSRSIYLASGTEHADAPEIFAPPETAKTEAPKARAKSSSTRAKRTTQKKTPAKAAASSKAAVTARGATTANGEAPQAAAEDAAPAPKRRRRASSRKNAEIDIGEADGDGG